MKTWNIPVSWMMRGTYYVDAATLNAAVEHIKKSTSIRLPKNGEYIDASFKLDYEDIDFLRNEFNDGQEDEIEFAPVIHAKWRLETDEEMPDPMFKLVVCCGCNEKANDMYSYCPNCGAKMDGGNDDGK